MARAMVRERRGEVLLVVLAASIPSLLHTGATLYTKLAGSFGWEYPLWLTAVTSFLSTFAGTVLMFGCARALANQAAGGEKRFEGFFFYANRELMGRALLLSLLLLLIPIAVTAIPGQLVRYGKLLTQPVGYENTGDLFPLPIYGEDYQFGKNLVSAGTLLRMLLGLVVQTFLFPVRYRFAFHPEDRIFVQIKESVGLGKENFGKILAMNFWLALPMFAFIIVGMFFIALCTALAALASHLLSVIVSFFLLALLCLGFAFYVPYMEVARLLLAAEIVGLKMKKQKKSKKA